MKDKINIYQITSLDGPESTPLCCYYPAKRTTKIPFDRLQASSYKGDVFLGFLLYCAANWLVLVYFGYLESLTPHLGASLVLMRWP